MKKCPYCAETDIQDEAIICKHCGKDLRPKKKKTQQEQFCENINHMEENVFTKEIFRSWIGALMIIGGLIVAAYFFFLFDTSVEVPTREIFGQTIGGGRINNLGLMADRQNGIIFGFGSAIVGAVIEFFARSRIK